METADTAHSKICVDYFLLDWPLYFHGWDTHKIILGDRLSGGWWWVIHVDRLMAAVRCPSPGPPNGSRGYLTTSRFFRRWVLKMLVLVGPWSWSMSESITEMRGGYRSPGLDWSHLAFTTLTCGTWLLPANILFFFLVYIFSAHTPSLFILFTSHEFTGRSSCWLRNLTEMTAANFR